MKKSDRKRFSKQTVIDELTRQIDGIQQEHNFDTDSGYAQVGSDDSLETRLVVDYGRFRALWDLRESIEEGSL